MTKTNSNKAAAAQAKAQGLKTFTALCQTHGETDHYASSSGCIACSAVNAGKRWERTREDTEALAKHNQRSRAAMGKLRQEPEQRAKDINSSAITRLRKLGRPVAAMPTRELLAECLAFIVHAPAGAEMDHAIPLKGTHPITGEWVVSGLHVAHNLEPMEARSNKRKSNFFDPENPLEFQKPYNSFPGGQFHGEVGEIEFMRYTQPTTLELWTRGEFVAAMVDAGNAAMSEVAA